MKNPAMTDLRKAARAVQSALCAKYEVWGKLQGRELGSADEEVLDERNTPEQREWLEKFIEAWGAWVELDAYANKPDESDTVFKSSTPEWLAEALNSGDGTYKP